MAPLLLLDVDGVLCPVGAGPRERMEQLEMPGGHVRFSALLRDRLHRLSVAFDFVWATSRDADADLLGARLGLGSLPVIPLGTVVRRQGATWKLTAVKAFVGDRAFAWVDDELGADAHAWARARDRPTLLVDVNPEWGLVDAHVAQLLYFSKQVTS